MSDTVEQRFWPKVEKTDSCWIWKAARRPDNYGQFKFRGQMMNANRVSWILHNGEIPDGLLVCHRCDNPPCINPDHLFLGSHQDNRTDAVKKGRIWVGHHRSRSTHCDKGHLFTTETTLVRKDGYHRRCRICWKLRHNAYRRERRAAIRAGKGLNV